MTKCHMSNQSIRTPSQGRAGEALDLTSSPSPPPSPSTVPSTPRLYSISVLALVLRLTRHNYYHLEVTVGTLPHPLIVRTIGKDSVAVSLRRHHQVFFNQMASEKSISGLGRKPSLAKRKGWTRSLFSLSSRSAVFAHLFLITKYSTL